jgi:hypothetical protein
VRCGIIGKIRTRTAIFDGAVWLSYLSWLTFNILQEHPMAWQIRRRGAAVIMLVALAMGWVTPRGHATPAVLDQAPANADLIIVVPSMAGFSQQWGNFIQQLGIPSGPEMTDPLGSIKGEMGLTNGLRDEGAALVVLPDLVSAIQNNAEPTFALLVPVTDYAAFVGNYGGTAGAGVATLTMPDGQPGFAKKLGDYAVLSNQQATVETYQAGNQGAALAELTGSFGKKYLDTADLAVVVNLTKLGPVLGPKLQQSIAQFTQMFDMVMPPGQAQMAKNIYTLYGEAGAAILRDGDGALLALDINEQGLTFNKAVKLKAGSPTAAYFPGGSSTSLLSKLPTQPYFMAWNMNLKALAMDKFMTTMSTALKALPAQGGNAAAGNENDLMVKMAALYDQMLPAAKTMTTTAGAWYAPANPGMVMGGLLNMVCLTQSDDPQALVAATKQYLTGINNLQMPMGPNAVMTMTTQYAPNEQQIEGVAVDRYSVQYQVPPEMMQQMQPMMMMMGGMGYQGYVAAKGKTVVVTTSTDLPQLQSTLTALGHDTGLGSAAGIVAARKALPENPAIEMYISLGGIMDTVGGFMAMMSGQPMPPAPADLPPLSMAMSIDRGSLGSVFHIPLRSAKHVTDTFLQMQAQRMGPPQPGNQAAPF